MRREKDISGCGVIGIINEQGNSFGGEGIVAGICNMMERGNGLGAGFAGYGIYPNFKDYWCFHMMYQDEGVFFYADVSFLTNEKPNYPFYL